ncbi:conserved exported hypothetical protein [Pseudomonas sp. 8Z]|uniref:hypothetical protein n=1 Tax=Pseudomonas sp. 8Z TaxID=2653166 RepID=UPI0012F39347|nr:hypothetical protein [Pseudomonas sp. 8Z]VXC67383.1 conserved exported hypothetical protein [Pseudomonas sp. 8Z]
MKITLNRVVLSTCLVLGAGAAQADDNLPDTRNSQKPYVFSVRPADPRLDKVIDDDGVWSVRVGRRAAEGHNCLGDECFADRYSGYNLRPQNLWVEAQASSPWRDG